MKKFITIALAVAVLFSFAACQPNGSYDVVQSAELGYTAVGKTVYLEGEAFDPEGYSFVLVNNVGGTTPVDTADLAFSEIAGEKVTVTYLGSLSLELSVEVESVDHITAEIPAGTQAYAKIAGGAGSATEKYTGEITVTAYNADETLSRVLAADEFTATYDSQNAADEAEVTVTANSKTPAEAPVIKVVEDTMVDFTIETDKECFYVGVAKTLITNFNEKAVWASGEEATGTLTFGTDLLSDEVTGNFAKEDHGSWSIYVYLAADESIHHKASLTVSDKYGATLDTAKLKDGTTVAKGGTITNDMFDVTGTLTSASEASPVSTAYIQISGDGGTTWGTSYYVSRFAETEPQVSIRVVYNGATSTYGTPITVPFPAED